MPITFKPHRDEMVVPAADLLGLAPDHHVQHAKSGSSLDGAHVSKELALLNQAATRFWANADRNDRATHPENKDIIAWLEDRDFSGKKATVGASIIRPEWAPTGRKPDE